MSPDPVGGRFSGVVLCGGASRRMGCDKALLPIEGVSMARRVATALEGAGAAEVLAVGGDAPALAALGLDVRADDQPGEGPLPATITALGQAREPVVLVVSCDLVSPDAQAMALTVGALLAHPDAEVAVPVVDGHRQWVHAAWRAGADQSLAAAYAAGQRSLRRAAEHVVVHEVHDLPPAATADADEPGDLPGRPRMAAGSGPVAGER